jgi:pyruvate formate lyase activating enzyme
MKQSIFIKKKENHKVICSLCPHWCTLEDGEMGKCGTRINKQGHIFSLVYGNFPAISIDSIEKKPLFHFYPGTKTFSVGTRGCNMSCPFCQNAGLAQDKTYENIDFGENSLLPEQMFDLAVESSCSSFSFTYSEPVLSMEYAHELYKISCGRLPIVFVSNGQINKEPLSLLCEFLSAANIDLKSSSKKTYSDILGGKLKPTQDTIETLVSSKIWVEITTLLVPGLNDSEAEIKEMAKFIKGLGDYIPWHISRFFPSYKWSDFNPTSVDAIKKACLIAKEEGLKYVYAGNIRENGYMDTYCPKCKSMTIMRRGYDVDLLNLKDGKCKNCNTSIEGVWKSKL